MVNAINNSYHRRYDPQYRRIWNGVQTGEVGRVRVVKVTSRDPPSMMIKGYLQTSGVDSLALPSLSASQISVIIQPRTQIVMIWVKYSYYTVDPYRTLYRTMYSYQTACSVSLRRSVLFRVLNQVASFWIRACMTSA